MKDTTTPGARLRAARRAADLTQAELAARLGTCKQHISDVERGTNTVSAAWLVRAAQALGRDPAELVPELARAFRGKP